MNSTPVIDMFSGTGELARAVADGLNEFTGFQSFSDNYGPARKYLKARFRNVEILSDFRDQDVPEGSIVAIGAPCQDLSVAGRHAGAERGSGSRSSLIHEALDMAVTGGASLIVAENVPGGHRTYLDLARWLETEHDYQTTVSSAGAWEVGPRTGVSASCSSRPGVASSLVASRSSVKSYLDTWCRHPPHRPRQGPVAQVEAAVPTFRPGSMKATAPLHSILPFGRTLQASPSLDSRTTKAD